MTWNHLDKPDELLPLLLQPENDAIARVAEEIVGELRAAGQRSELRPVQEHLTRELIAVEAAYRQASKLLKTGRGDQHSQRFWRRATVQLRSVGDGIAWHFLDYRRQWLLFLGRNQHPGIMSDKPGFADEWAAFERHWDADEPTLLTGLTNCVTIGDLLVARGPVLLTLEVKRTAGRSRRAQRDRMREVERQINVEPRIGLVGGDSWVWESSVPFGSLWSGADPYIGAALDRGCAAWVPTAGVAIMFTAWRTAMLLGREEFEPLLNEQQQVAQDLVGYHGTRIVVHSKDLPFRSVRVAPMSIYPITPKHAAALLTGRVLFTVELYPDRLVDELRQPGQHPVSLLDSGPGGPIPERIIEWHDGGRRVTVVRNALEQLAYDLTDPKSWAVAFTQQPAPPTARRWASYTCLANEGAVWA
jgi:hypothetical protein